MNLTQQGRRVVDSAVKHCRENPHFVGLFILCGTGFFSAGYVWRPAIDFETLRTLLSVLIGAQASVLAIVISVTLISTQLVATRYAPRMATLPFRTALFQSTFLLFGGSIMLDVVLLIDVSTSVISEPVYSGLLGLAVSGFIAAIGSLYFFITGMVAKTAPETLVTLFTETISPSEYLTKTRAHAERPEENAHPLQPLYRFVMAALSENEIATAQTALAQYQTYTDEVLEELDDRDVFEIESRDCQEALFESVLKEHLHEITIQGGRRDEFQIIQTAVETQVKLGKQGLTIETDNRIPDQSIRGIRYTIIDAPVTPEDHSTLNQTWPAVGKLMEAETEYDRDKVLRKGNNLIKSKLGISIRRANNPQWHRDAIYELFNDLQEANLTIVERVSTEIGLDVIDLRKPQRLDEEPAGTICNQARYTKEAMMSVTQTLLQYRIEEGDWLVPDGSFRSDWGQLCIDTAASEATEYAVYFCKIVIEIALLETIHGPYDQPASRQIQGGVDSDSLTWSNHLATIHKDTEPPILERAFKELLGYEYQANEPPRRPTLDDDKSKNKYYYSELSMGTFGALNCYENYQEILQKLEQQSISQE